MLNQQTIEKLNQLKLKGMLAAVERLSQTQQLAELNFTEGLGLLCDNEITERKNKRIARLLKMAKLRYPQAMLEDIKLENKRTISVPSWQQLSSGNWLGVHDNILLTGPTGVGKTYLACACGQLACRNNYVTRYFRLSKLLESMRIAKADGSYSKLLALLLKVDCLILDDWGLDPVPANLRADLLEVIDDRYDQRSVVIGSQIPVEHWHDYLGDSTIADALLDRIVHKAITLELKGESLRKNTKPQKD